MQKGANDPGCAGSNRKIAPKAAQVLGAGLAPKPGDLALGVLAGGEEGELDGLVDGQPALDDAEGFLVSNCFKRLCRRGQALTKELTDLLDESGFEHLARPESDLCAKRSTFREENQFKRREAAEGSSPGGEEPGSGASREETDLEGANEFLMIVEMDPGGGGGIEPEEEAVESAGAACFEGQQALAEGGVALWSGAETIQGGAEVEAGSAGEDRKASS